ncbi:hypothetical protein Tco_1453519, partial [Tanacetum coccineum]
MLSPSPPTDSSSQKTLHSLSPSYVYEFLDEDVEKIACNKLYNKNQGNGNGDEGGITRLLSCICVFRVCTWLLYGFCHKVAFAIFKHLVGSQTSAIMQEEEALCDGDEKHGIGNWISILSDSQLALPKLINQTSII